MHFYIVFNRFHLTFGILHTFPALYSNVELCNMLQLGNRDLNLDFEKIEYEGRSENIVEEDRNREKYPMDKGRPTT